MIRDGFKAHDARHGPKLGQALASGVSGLARRFGADEWGERVEAARAKVRAEIEARRPSAAPAADIEAGAREFVDSVLPNAAPAVRAEVAGKVGRRMAKVVGVRKSGPKGGRPKEIEGEPWAAAGVSRRTWERRRKKEAGDGRA